jgi:putative hydrolase
MTDAPCAALGTDQGAVPRMRVPVTELHAHTIMSGHAFGTLDEMTRAAADLGIEILAVTDHGPAMTGAPTSGYFEMAGRLPSTVHGVRLLPGCEANIIDRRGRIDLAVDLASQQSFVLAGLHDRTPYPGDAARSANTDAVIGALAHPFVHGISHPVRLPFPVEPKVVAEAACAHGKLLEVNLSVFAQLRPTSAEALREHPVVAGTREAVTQLVSGGGHFMLNTDAHHMSELSTFRANATWTCDLLGLQVTDAVNYNQTLLAAYVPALCETALRAG